MRYLEKKELSKMAEVQTWLMDEKNSPIEKSKDD